MNRRTFLPPCRRSRTLRPRCAGREPAGLCRGRWPSTAPIPLPISPKASRCRSPIRHLLGRRRAGFASAANRDLFDADPTAYAPQYGGYCAWAAAEGYVASTVPEAWTIHDGRLYLNFSRRMQRRWERDIPGNIARGNANWPAILTA